MFDILEKKYNINYIMKDTILVSYPKSGRTWLRMILAKILDGSRIDVSKYEMMPAFHSSNEQISINRASGKNIFNRDIRGHDINILFLHRDAGDTAVSLHAEMNTSTKTFGGWVGRSTATGEIVEQVGFPGSISEFLRHPHYGLFGEVSVIDYNNRWLRNANKFKSFKAITYEELHGDAFKTIHGVMSFLAKNDAVLRFEINKDIIKKAIEYSAFDNMKKIEVGGPNADRNLLFNYKGNFGKQVHVHIPGEGPYIKNNICRIREGKVRNYINTLSKKDVDFIEIAKSFGNDGHDLYKEYHSKVTAISSMVNQLDEDDS